MTEQDVQEVQQHMAAVKINNSGELNRLQEKQRAAVSREINRSRGRERESDHDPGASPPSSAGLHPDLQLLSFGELGSNQG